MVVSSDHWLAHVQAKDGLQSGLLCNRGTFRKFNPARESSFTAKVHTDDNNRLVHYFTYLPNLPPTLTKPAEQVARDTRTAPYKALMPRAKNMIDASRLSVDSRSRNRTQVGSTNRWRLNSWLGTDLLGTSQAVKATVQRSPAGVIARHIQAPNTPSVTSEDECTSPLLEPTQEDAKPQEEADRPASVDSGGSSLGMPHDNGGRGGHSERGKGHVNKDEGAVTVSRSTTPGRGLRSNTPFQLDKTTLGDPDVVVAMCGAEFELHTQVVHRSRLLKRAVLSDGTRGVPAAAAVGAGRSKGRGSGGHGPGVSAMYRETIRPVLLSERVRDWRRMSHDQLASQLDHVASFTVEVPGKEAVTRQGLSIALGCLYETEIFIRPHEAHEVCVAARAIEFPSLVNRCLEVMLSYLTPETVGPYSTLADTHGGIPQLDKACVRWLAAHLVPTMADSVELRHLPMKLLADALVSKHLYVESEFGLYRVVCTWLFLQLNPSFLSQPPWSSVVTHFNSQPKWTAFLSKEENQMYNSVFGLLRLHAVTDPGHLETLTKMNIMPQTWLLQLLTMNYRALQAGGDMSLMMSFENSAARFGIIVNTMDERRFEVVSLNGFFFEISATPTHMLVEPAKPPQPNQLMLQIRRLKPGDPSLASGSRDSKLTFSMRQDRELLYSISSQWESGGRFVSVGTGVRRQRFAFGAKLARSEPHTVDDVELPCRIVFSILFPPS